jgi:acetyl esterase
MLEGFRDRYLRGPDDRRNPYASPLLAPDHRGLPPALIIVGERDVLRDDGLLYGAALAAQGVPVDVLRLAGQGHAVAPWALAAEQAREPLEAAVQALRAVFYGGDVAPDM